MAQYSSNIVDRILGALPADRSRVKADFLLSDLAIPNVVRGFALMELEIAVSADLHDLKAHFQLSESFELSFYRTLFIGLAENASLDISDARKLLEQATDDAIRFLSEPETFLIQLLGQARNEIPLDDQFFHSFSYIQEYDYLRDVLLAWSERRRADGCERLDQVELWNIVRDIDRAVAGNYTIQDIQHLLSPLFALFGGHSIPRELLQRFFYDKGATPVLRALRDDIRAELSLTETLDLLAVLMHQAHTPADQAVPRAHTAPIDPHYAEFLQELRQAGVSLAAPSESQYLEAIQKRAAQSE